MRKLIRIEICIWIEIIQGWIHLEKVQLNDQIWELAWTKDQVVWTRMVNLAVMESSWIRASLYYATRTEWLSLQVNKGKMEQ